MMDFNSIDSFYANLIQTMGIALKEAMEKAREKAYEYIENEWYGKHDSKFYIRTYNMVKSLYIDYDMPSEGVFNAELYIKNDELHPASNSYNREPVTYESLYEWFTDGFGGEIDSNEDILEYTQQVMFETREIFNIIKSVLSSYGFELG